MFSYFPRELQITGTEQDNAALSGEKWGVKCIEQDWMANGFLCGLCIFFAYFAV
jgi:hypothetical protein